MTDSVIPQARRLWNTGDTAIFPFKAVDGTGAAVALLPGYPTYAIISPSGIQVDTGVAQTLPTPGLYQVTFTIPLQAELSTPTLPWRVEVQILTARRSPKTLEYVFDVQNHTTDTTERRDIIETHLQGGDYRAIWRGDAVPDTLTLECYLTSSPDNPGVAPIPVPIQKTALQQSNRGMSVEYFFDITSTLFDPGVTSFFKNQFTLLWRTRDTPTSELQTQYQQLRVMKRAGFELVTGVRFMVDRFQQRLGSAYGISDGDICEALDRGLGMLNQWFPVSSPYYTDSLVPDSLKTFWIMLASWWMLSSQYMLAGSLAFNFCVAEDTWVRTDHGLFQLKHLNDANLSQDVIWDMMCSDLAGDSKVTFEDILKGVENELASGGEDHDAWVQTAETMARYIRNASKPDDGPRQENLFPHRRLDTPLGVQTPYALWDLGVHDVWSMRTHLGYDLRGTHNHPVLVLDSEMKLVQKHLSEVTSGDTAAVCIDPEQARDDSEYQDLSQVASAVEAMYPDAEVLLPDQMTRNLATVLGYMCATGTTVSIDTPEHHSQYVSAWCSTFGISFLGANARQVKAVQAYLRGIGYASNTRIPWSIMCAPLPATVQFLRTLFQGDGVYASGEPTYREGVPSDVGTYAVWTTKHERFRVELQQLLLRFGVVSYRPPGVDGKLSTVTMLGLGLNEYAARVGFVSAGSHHNPTQAELHLPPSVAFYLDTVIPKRLRGTLFQSRISYESLTRYMADAEHVLALKEAGVPVQRIQDLLRHRFLFVDIISVQPDGTAHVYDPSLPVQRIGLGAADPMSNLFYTNSLVTHNSGQSISLDQDLTGTIDASITRLVEWLNTHLTAAKLMLFRQQAHVGSLGVRPYRIVGPNARVYRMDSTATGSVGGPPNLQAVAQILGILS
jgi:hypothetical protein